MAKEAKRIDELEALLAESKAENVALRKGVSDAMLWASDQMNIETDGLVLAAGLCGKLSFVLHKGA